ncbi:MAG: 16S rRNA (adenine(1518)-N(6)/adenine(1519)-N(6))-dimethyltransferase RsmA [Chloroflexota bacterium]
MIHPKEILERHGIYAKKSLGQNFLYEESILRRIVETADVSKSDDVLEVGPGLGSLTLELAAAAHRVVAVELDDRMIPILRMGLGRCQNVSVVHQDILEMNPADKFAHSQFYKVVANVPYYITGAIIRHLLQTEVRPSMMVLTVQKDVGERMTAKPGSMSLMAVSTQFYGQVKMMFNLSAGSFYPRPKVASSVVRIDVDKRPEAAKSITDEKLFFRIAKAGFSQKRKQLLNNLKGLGFEKSVVGEWCQTAGIDGKRRAETLSVEEWVDLYHHMPA